VTLTSSPDAFTVPVAVANFTGSPRFEIPLGTISAASVVITIPLVALVVIFQRRIVAGMTAGAVVETVLACILLAQAVAGRGSGYLCTGSATEWKRRGGTRRRALISAPGSSVQTSTTAFSRRASRSSR
jgi:hypothetical protein